MPYMIAPLGLVKGENQYPEYRQILQQLFDGATRRAAQIWNGFEFGGVVPGPRQYGMTPIRPRDIFGGGTATYIKRYGSQGSWTDLFSYNVPEDLIHGWAGVAFTDPDLIFAALRWRIEDKLFPIINIEEAHAWSNPFAVLFKQDAGKEIVVPEEQPVLIRAFQERSTSASRRRVVPLGFSLYKNKDLVITERETGN